MSIACGLPDLLRRHVVTAYQFTVLLYSTVITFETNDQELLAAFRARAAQVASALVSSGKPWYWKVVRDYDVSQDGNNVFLLSGESLSTVFLGSGTVVAIDWNQGELLGFVAANISAQQLLDVLIEVGQQHHHLQYEHGSTRGSRCNPKPT